jgi:hypothetical protein
MLELLAVGALLAGLASVVIGLKRLRRRRLASGTAHCGLGAAWLLVATALIGAAINMFSYHRLSGESAVATLSFRQLEPQRFAATLEVRGETGQVFELFGDEWQLDARFLKWKPYATLLGHEPLYRLDRLSGRFRRVADQRVHRPSAYDLGSDAGVDVWSLAQDYGHWLPWVDAYYGTATFLPMVDGGRYTVTASHSGLLARPHNKPATNAVLRWPWE